MKSKGDYYESGLGMIAIMISWSYLDIMIKKGIKKDIHLNQNQN